MLSQLVNRCRPLPSGSRLLILGQGYSGKTVSQLFQSLGTPVLGTRRQANQGANDLCFDSDAGIAPSLSEIADVTHMLSCIPPTKDGHDPVLNQLQPLLRQLPLRWVGYLSTTGVYGDTGGQWVCESDTANPSQERSRRRLDCEQAWLQSGLPVQILRLPGIYGPRRSVITALQQGRARLMNKAGQVFCRVHVEDIAGASLHLMHCANAGQRPQIVNVCDDHPAPSSDLLRFAASLLRCPLPAEESFEDSHEGMSAMARSFWSENRRVSNRLLRQHLGYDLLHPDFHSGLQDCWQQDVSQVETFSDSQSAID
ncbi:SDR family oxidoreductase [Synechococcus sp. CC9616]|uniref:SDR family oxidoreductase n=1 Tax=Synechococcus sp. CC9616 TaxID=110663 RepID=UPI00048EED70|nr:SDR family oxidoreductase [Synechococcus sp. CC9616]